MRPTTAMPSGTPTPAPIPVAMFAAGCGVWDDSELAVCVPAADTGFARDSWLEADRIEAGIELEAVGLLVRATEVAADCG